MTPEELEKTLARIVAKQADLDRRVRAIRDYRIPALINEYDIEDTFSPPMVRVYNAGALTIGTGGVGLALPYDSERFDTHNMHDTTTNTSRLTCKTAGLYLLCGGLTFAANSTGRRRVYIRLNGSTTLAAHEQNASPIYETFLDITTLYKLVVGDYVEIVGYQDSGSSLSVIFANYSPEFMAVWLGL